VLFRDLLFHPRTSGVAEEKQRAFFGHGRTSVRTTHRAFIFLFLLDLMKCFPPAGHYKSVDVLGSPVPKENSPGRLK